MSCYRGPLASASVWRRFLAAHPGWHATACGGIAVVLGALPAGPVATAPHASPVYARSSSGRSAEPAASSWCCVWLPPEPIERAPELFPPTQSTVIGPPLAFTPIDPIDPIDPLELVVVRPFVGARPAPAVPTPEPPAIVIFAVGVFLIAVIKFNSPAATGASFSSRNPGGRARELSVMVRSCSSSAPCGAANAAPTTPFHA